jgi:hypothetical protein
MFITAAVLVVASAAFAQPANQQVVTATHNAVVAEAPLDRAQFQDAMRKLWEDHVTWTRLYIVSAVAGLPDAQAAAERLLQNQTDIGNAIKPFYGDAGGDRLTSLLKPHILIAAELITAAKAGKSADVKAASTRWYDNANEIADFLSAANPKNWPQATMRNEMRNHPDLTLEEAQARLRGDWKADIAAYEKIHHHILGMADVLSNGIVSQFAERFGK